MKYILCLLSIFNVTMQVQPSYTLISGSRLEFIQPTGFTSTDNISFVDTTFQVTISFLVFPSAQGNLRFTEVELKGQGYEVVEKHAIKCEVETSEFFLVKNHYMPGFLSKEFFAMFYDGENKVLLTGSFEDIASFRAVKENLLRSLSTIRRSRE